MTHITIIGGGIAGLATAFYLQRQAQQIGLPLRYTLLESGSRLGGKIVTETVDNFIVEGGPDSFLTQKPGGLQLCRDLGISDRLIPTNDERRNVYVLRDNRLIPFPAGYRLAVPTQFMPFALSPLISPLGKLRMGLDLFIPPRRDSRDESLADFIRRRLGQEALDMIAEPLMAGIYTADPEKLSLQSTFPMFADLERQHGSLIKAMQVAKQKANRRPPPTDQPAKKPAMFNSLRHGMADLVASITQQLEGEIRLNSRVTGLRQSPTGCDIMLADSPPQSTTAVVIATPANVAAPLVAPLSAELADRLRSIRYASTATISLGYRWADLRSQHDLDGFGFVIPQREKRYILACTWSSSKFDYRTDDSHALIRVFVGGAHQGQLVGLSDEALITLARMEILVTMGITAEPVLQRIFRWPQGTPQYDVGHLDRVADMERLAATIPGLYLTGSSFRGIGIPDCVQTAQQTVAQLLNDLTG